MDKGSAIFTAGLTKCYGPVTALNQLNLDIQKGEIYGFLGLNGAGKTTAIRLLVGMIRPTSGQAWILGEKVQPGFGKVWEKVGYMVETPHAYPDLTVQENLEVTRRLRRLSDRNLVPRVIDALGLNKESGRLARHLSLGNAQRLGLAKAFIHNPELLILDEPINGLDPAGIAEIRNLLGELARNQGVTIFISSHILSEIARLADRIGIVHQGVLIKELRATDLITREQTQLRVEVIDNARAAVALKRAAIDFKFEPPGSFIILGKSAIEHPEEIAILLVQADCPPTQIVRVHTDLESYFLNLVGTQKELIK